MKKAEPTPQGVTAFIAEARQMQAEQTSASTQDAPETPVIDWQQYEVDFTLPAPQPHFLLEINGTPVLPLGGITAITGRAKQGKTQFLAALTATLMSGKPFGGLRRLEPAERILWCDTEQSIYSIHNTIHRVYQLADIAQGEPSRRHGLSVLHLRPIGADARRQAIAAAVAAYKPHLLIIDGVRDLLYDFNDVAESSEVVNWLLSLADTSMRIAVVLHTNPAANADKMRGHIGTELENKFGDRFMCSKDNGVFTVTHESRDTAPMLSPFVFCIDGRGSLSLSTIAAAAGVVDDDAAFAAAVPDEGAEFEVIVRSYASRAGIPQKAARDALKERLHSTPPTLEKRADKRFYRVANDNGTTA